MPDPSPAAAETELRRSRKRRFTYALIIAASLAVLLARVVTVQPLMSSNDISRWMTVWSLVERGTYVIDDIHARPGWHSLDKVRHDGHFYSSKPPLLSTAVAGLYWGVKQTTGAVLGEEHAWDLLGDTAYVVRTILILVNLVPWAIALVLLARMAERYAQSHWAAVYVVAAAAFGTFLTTFQVTFNNHTVAATALVFSLYPALRILSDGARGPLLFATAGFFAAVVTTSELPAALFGVVLFFLLLRKSPQRTLLCFAPAALIPIAAFFWTNYLQTGGWKPFYMYYGTEKYVYVHEGEPSYWSNPTGLDAGRDSFPQYLLHCTVGHHGILSLTPLLLLTLLSWLAVRRWSHPSLRWLHRTGLLLTAAILAFYLSRTENYNYGGNTAGLRWTFWLIPFWLLGLIPALDGLGDRRWFRLASVALFFVSAVSAFYPLEKPWQPPWLYVLMEKWDWIDYSDPKPKFETPLTTWFSTLPEPDESGNGPWIEFAAADFDGTPSRFRLTAGTREELAEGTVQAVIVTWDPGTGQEQTQTLPIDASAFAAGKQPEDFLRWPAEAPPGSEQAEAAAFLRGMPSARPYNAERIRYRKVPLRPREAFRCTKAASRVKHALGEGDAKREYWHRCDTWTCPDVPFGCVEVIFEVKDALTDEVVSRRVYQAVAASSIATAPASEEISND